jgi:tetratricopeptide (TPR) repeat protein
MNKTNWTEILNWKDEQLDDLRLIAYTYIKEGIYDVALTLFDALALLTPQSAYDLQTVGALYLQMGDSLKALETLDRALKLDPDHLPTQLNRAKALFMLGYKEQGLIQAKELVGLSDTQIADQAEALVLANS